MSPTTAPSDGASVTTGADPGGERVHERMNDMKAVVEKLPPETNPPLPFVVWPVPPDMSEGEA